MAKTKANVKKDADLKRISKYLNDLDNRVEQWGQETTAEAANNTLGYMENQLYELNETIRKLDEKISKTKGDSVKLMVLKSRAKTHQQQIKDRVERINNYLSKLVNLQGKACQLAGVMKKIASVIITSFPNDNPKIEESGETLDETLKRKAEDLKKYWEYNPNDFSYAADNAGTTFQNRNMISIRHVLGSTLDEILWLLQLYPKYENADLAEPLENKRDDVLSYLDKIEGKTIPETPKSAGTRQGNQNQHHIAIDNKAWSNPMTKSTMMQKVGIDGYKKFNTFAKQYGLRKAGNRQLWQICLDGMDRNIRQKFEKT